MAVLGATFLGEIRWVSAFYCESLRIQPREVRLPGVGTPAQPQIAQLQLPQGVCGPQPHRESSGVGPGPGQGGFESTGKRVLLQPAQGEVPIQQAQECSVTPGQWAGAAFSELPHHQPVPTAQPAPTAEGRGPERGRQHGVPSPPNSTSRRLAVHTLTSCEPRAQLPHLLRTGLRALQ